MERKLFLEPTENEWESAEVLNPTAIKEDGVTHLIYRAVKKPNFSCLGHAEVRNGEILRYNEPLLSPTEDYERKGIEDPRITKIDGTYYILYTAWDGQNARIALASGPSINELTKQGIISPNITMKKAIEVVGSERYREIWKKEIGLHGESPMLWDKDAVLLPEKIGGMFVMIHRLEPDMQAVFFDSFEDLKKEEFWIDYLKNIESRVLMKQKHKWESTRIGAGATPIKTDRGWLLLYHGVEEEGGKRTYRAGAALVDDNMKELSRLENPLFEPDFDWEKNGDVSNVVFPEGAILENDTLEVYYGCADTRIGLAKVSISELLSNLLKFI